MSCEYRKVCEYYDDDADNQVCNGDRQWYCGKYKDVKREDFEGDKQ